MSRRFYNLPPLTTLSAFEAAARHLSFKDAAQELSVTPGAVSHQIKALEGELGILLFQRKHRGVELTPDGSLLFDALASSFSKISQSLQNIRDKNAGDVVTIGSTSAVASLWLAPSVSRFWRRHPEINVNQFVRDRGFGNTDTLDLLIRYGRDRDARPDQAALYRDVLVPVGTRKMADELTGCDLAVLAQQRLIHLESEDRSWTSWGDWFEQLGYSGPIAQGVRVNNYAIALQAAQDGAGLALGWQRLVQPLLRARRLVPIGPHVQPAPHRFHIVSRVEQDLSASAKKLKDWIIAEVQHSSDEMSSPVI